MLHARRLGRPWSPGRMLTAKPAYQAEKSHHPPWLPDLQRFARVVSGVLWREIRLRAKASVGDLDHGPGLPVAGPSARGSWSTPQSKVRLVRFSTSIREDSGVTGPRKRAGLRLDIGSQK
jgi:hypothetical protein